ncbi:MAG: hypothetical protein ABW171_00675 [Steroidobacter sp.]
MSRGKVTVVAVILGLSATVQAQVATGPWSSWNPSFNTQTAGCGSISGSTFSLSCSSSSGEQRAERRYETFSSGVKQFQGTVRVNSLGGDRISLQQTFASDAWSMIAVKKPGSLYQVRGGQTLANYSIGSSVRINAVCYTGSDKVVNYVNGSLVQTYTGGSGSYYFKLGAYRTDSGAGPVSVTWSGISFYQK